MYADISISPRNLGGMYNNYIDLVWDGSIQSINYHISQAQGFKTKKVRIMSKTEVYARKSVCYTAKAIDRVCIILAKNISEAVVYMAISLDEWVGERYEKVTGKNFEEKYTEKDIFNLVRQVPQSLRKNPTYSGLSGLFPTMSKRQIGKIRARIKKESEFCKNDPIIPA